MSMTPTFAMRPSFLGTANADPAAPVCVAGIPFDIGTTNRAGSRFGPHAIRHASRMLVDGDNPANGRSTPGLPFADVGDFTIRLGETADSLAIIEEQAAHFQHLVALGGDHTIALPLLRAVAKRQGGPVGLIHFDAHVDTWPDCFGQPYGHGSVFYHAIQEGLIDPHRMVQIGIRSPVENAVLDWTLSQGVTILSAEDVHEKGVATVAAAIRAVVGKGKTYLSFDIDCLDPAFAPGTGTPEIGGLASWQALGLMRRLAGLDFVGMDMVEVLPAHDHAELTALAAATFAWQYLSMIDFG